MPVINNATISTDAALRNGLKAAGSPNAKAVLNDAELFAWVLGMFNETVKMASGKPTDIAFAATRKALSTTKLVGKAQQSESIQVGTTAAQILITTASLVSVVGKPQYAVLSMVGATFAKKMSLAFGLVGKDDKQAKCIAALTDVAAAGLTTAAATASLATGVGAVLFAASVAQLALSGVQAYKACVAE